MGFNEVGDRVATELVLGAAGELPRDRRLGDDCKRLDRLHVTALDERLRRFAGFEIDGVERLHQRRQRLHGGAHNERLAVRDPGLESARAIRAPGEPGVDLVVCLRAAHAGKREAVAHLNPLDGLDPHQRKREPGVEPVGLLGIGAEAGRATSGDDFDDATERIAILAGGVCGLAHAIVALGAAHLERPTGD